MRVYLYIIHVVDVSSQIFHKKMNKKKNKTASFYGGFITDQIYFWSYAATWNTASETLVKAMTEALMLTENSVCFNRGITTIEIHTTTTIHL